MPPLGPHHQRVRRLRSLLRDPRARRGEGAFVLEGPRVVAAALDRGARLESVYLGYNAEQGFPDLVARLREAGVPVESLKRGVLERVADAMTPQPVLAVAPIDSRGIDALPSHGLVVVAVELQDPGNAGTLLRSAESAGVTGVVFCGNSVDPYGPKVVRSSAGAIFGLPVLEAADPVDVLDALKAQGRRCLAAAARNGAPYDQADLTGPVALLLGNEARGLPATVTGRVDGTVTIPLAPPGDSLNVAMAGTVLAFEAARQRRARR